MFSTIVCAGAVGGGARPIRGADVSRSRGHDHHATRAESAQV